MKIKRIALGALLALALVLGTLHAMLAQAAAQPTAAFAIAAAAPTATPQILPAPGTSLPDIGWIIAVLGFSLVGSGLALGRFLWRARSN